MCPALTNVTQESKGFICEFIVGAGKICDLQKRNTKWRENPKVNKEIWESREMS